MHSLAECRSAPSCTPTSLKFSAHDKSNADWAMNKRIAIRDCLSGSYPTEPKMRVFENGLILASYPILALCI